MRMARSRYAGSRYFSQVSAGSRTWPSESTTNVLAEVGIAVSLQAQRRHGTAAPCYALILFVPSSEGQPDRMAPRFVGDTPPKGGGVKQSGGSAVAIDFSPDPAQRLTFVINQNNSQIEIIERATGKSLGQLRPSGQLPRRVQPGARHRGGRAGQRLSRREPRPSRAQVQARHAVRAQGGHSAEPVDTIPELCVAPDRRVSIFPRTSRL